MGKAATRGARQGAPNGPDWLHEIKLDGYRMHARLDAGRVQILTRRGNDWTDKYPGIAKAIAGLPAQNAYLDGTGRGGMVPRDAQADLGDGGISDLRG
jgi:ATP-dependent DNA ligase